MCCELNVLGPRWSSVVRKSQSLELKPKATIKNHNMSKGEGKLRGEKGSFCKLARTRQTGEGGEAITGGARRQEIR